MSTVAKPVTIDRESLSFRQSVAQLKNQHAKWDDKHAAPAEWWAAAKAVIREFAALSEGAPLGEPLLHFAEWVAMMARNFFEQRKDKQTSEAIDGMPGRELCKGVNGLLSAVPLQFPKLETVKVLEKEKVPITQIAKMHGLEVHVVQQIIDGELEYPLGHVTPHERDQVARKRRIRETLKLALNAWQVEAGQREHRKGTVAEESDEGETTPEMLARGELFENIRVARTLRQTLRDGVDAATAATIYEVDPDSVVEEALNLGLVPQDGEPARGDNVSNPTPADDALVDEIISLHESGAGSGVIHEKTGAPMQKIASVIKTYQKRTKTAATK